MKEQTARRTQNIDANIFVTGPVKNLSLPKIIYREKVKKIQKILWADQPVLDQGKAPKDKWLDEFSKIAETLSKYQTTLRFHPSTTPKSREQQISSLPASIMLDDKIRDIDGAYLRGFDCVVTYYSTVFLDCLAASIPCIIFRTSSLEIELPFISHPLLKYASSLDDLYDILNEQIAEDYMFDLSGNEIFDHIDLSEGYSSCSILIRALLNRYLN